MTSLSERCRWCRHLSIKHVWPIEKHPPTAERLCQNDSIKKNWTSKLFALQIKKTKTTKKHILFNTFFIHEVNFFCIWTVFSLIENFFFDWNNFFWNWMIKTQMSYPCMAQTQKRLLQSKRTFSIIKKSVQMQFLESQIFYLHSKTIFYIWKCLSFHWSDFFDWFCCLFVWSNFFFDWMIKTQMSYPLYGPIKKQCYFN